VGTGRPSIVEPVTWLPERGKARTHWAEGDITIGRLRHRVGEQGITAVPGALLPQRLPRTVTGNAPVTVTATRGVVDIDALLVRPTLSIATFPGDRTVTLLFSVQGRQAHQVDRAARAYTYDARGRLLRIRTVASGSTVRVPAMGVVVLIER